MPSGSSGSLSTSLIQRLKVHNQDAWRRLLDLYVPLVFSWCRRSGLQSQDAEDVVQEVFQAVNRAIGDFQLVRPTDTFRGWLRTITRNKIHDHFRNRASQPLAAGGTDAHQRFMDVAAESQIAGEPDPLVGVVRRAMGLIRAEIEDRTWQAFWLTTVGQQSTAAVAQQLGMTPGAVRQAKYKVLRRLRQELGDVE